MNQVQMRRWRCSKGFDPNGKNTIWSELLTRLLEAAVNLSVRFDVDHQLPDKAIDLVDKAGARTKIPMLSMRMDKDRDKLLKEPTGIVRGGRSYRINNRTGSFRENGGANRNHYWPSGRDGTIPAS